MKLNFKYNHFTLNDTSFFKGVGILLIAFHNFFHWVNPNPGENEFKFSADKIHGLWNGLIHNPADSVNLLFSYFGHYGVQLFILFSGYGLMRAYMNRKISWSDFILKRLNKLYPTFIIAALILILIITIKYNYFLGYLGFRDFFIKLSLLSNLIPGKALTLNGPWWFYSMIVQLYAVFPLIVLLYKKFKEKALFAVVVLSYVLLILFNDYFVSIDLSLYYQFIGHLPEFILGVFFATRKEIKLNVFVVLGFVVLFALGNIYELPWYFSHLSVTVILFVIVSYLLKKTNHNRVVYKGIIFYGEISMYLFAVHGFLREYFVNLANDKNNAFYTILIAVGFVITSTLVAVIVKYIEKYYLKIYKTISGYLIRIDKNKKIFTKIFDFFRLYYKYALILLLLLLIIKVVELFVLNYTYPSVNINSNSLYNGIFSEFYNVVGQAAFFALPLLILFFISKKLTKIIIITGVSFIVIINLILVQYFRTTLVPLDHVVFVYTFKGLLKIINLSVDINFYTFIPFIIILLIFALFIKVFKKLRISNVFIVLLFVIGSVFAKKHYYFILRSGDFENDIQYFYANNKLSYFVQDVYHYLKEKNNKTTTKELKKSIRFYHNKIKDKDFISDEYPLIYNEDFKVNTLGNFVKTDKKIKPNIVFIIVESLCDQISGKYASIGSFTPFLDSLEQHSLYWRNNVSSSERTFGVLPTVLGSLPPAKTGFAETETMPLHFSILNLLNNEKYKSYFYYGGWMGFDNMKDFLLKNQISELVSNYDTTYVLDTTKYDSWGYPDQILFKKGAQDFVDKKQPFVDIFLTVSTHSPFLLRNQDIYIKKVDKIIAEKKYSSEFLNVDINKQIMSTVMYLDDAIKQYFNAIKNTENFKNTIFVITGDHKMGVIPINNNIEKYHVPLIIYSPMLTKSQEFGAVVSHYDIAPSLVSLLKNNFNVNFPSQMHFIGTNIDTSINFNAKKFVPFMRVNRDILDICYNGKFLTNGKTYKIKDNLKTERETENDDTIKNLLKSFIDINNYVCDNNKIMPVNLYRTLNVSTYLYSLSTNFDKNIPKYYSDYFITTDTSFSGKKSIFIKPEHEFISLIPEQKINNTYNRLFFNVRFKILTKDTVNSAPVIVCHIVDKYNNTVFWNKISFFHTQKIENNKWVFVNESMQVPVNNPKKGYIFKAYIWNSKSTFYIDDLEVSVEGKPVH